MFIRTQRLFLRPVFPEDWRAIYRGIADERVVRMLATAPWPYGVEDAIAFCDGAPARGPFLFAVTVPTEGGALIGMIGLEDRDTDDVAGGGDALELGFWIARRWQGKGYATEAVAGVIATAAALGVRKVLAAHFLDNPASGRVLRKAGFAETGEVRPTTSLGRSGESALTRRYALDLEPGMPARTESAAA